MSLRAIYLVEWLGSGALDLSWPSSPNISAIKRGLSQCPQGMLAYFEIAIIKSRQLVTLLPASHAALDAEPEEGLLPPSKREHSGSQLLIYRMKDGY